MKPHQRGFDDMLEQRIRGQVGEAKWLHSEAIVERMLANKNWNLPSSSVLKLAQHQGSYW